MKTKKVLSLLTAMSLTLASFVSYANEPGEDILIMPGPDAMADVNSDGVSVEYNDDAIVFDVEPIIENGRTLVPLRAIFETMGCVVDYSVNEAGGQIVSARRADDNLILTIGEEKMYFNSEPVNLDVPAKIKDGRTLVPIRAISEAFECEVKWNDDKRLVSIYTPAGVYNAKPQKLEKSFTADDGTLLIEAIAYYPVFSYSPEMTFLEEMNFDYKFNAESFIGKVSEFSEEALLLYEQMGKDDFVPFRLELTYDIPYNYYGYISINNHYYMNTGGIHPTTTMESSTFRPDLDQELPLAEIIDEESIGKTLPDLVRETFTEVFSELGLESDSNGKFEELEQGFGYVQFHLVKDGVILYFNPGDITPYALGRVSTKIPYNPQDFLIGMHFYEDGYVYEAENDRGYEWVIVNYTEDKLAVTQSYLEYDESELLSEYYPIGMNTITVTGIEKGNGKLALAYVEEGKDVSEATGVLISTFYVDDDNTLILVNQSDDPNDL